LDYKKLKAENVKVLVQKMQNYHFGSRAA